MRPRRRTLGVCLAAGDRWLIERHVGAESVLRVGSHPQDDVVLPLAEVGAVRPSMQLDAETNAFIEAPTGLPLQLRRGGRVPDVAAARVRPSRRERQNPARRGQRLALGTRARVLARFVSVRHGP